MSSRRPASCSAAGNKKGLQSRCKQGTFSVEIVVFVGAHGGHDGEGVVGAGVLQLDRLLARLAVAVVLDWCID